MHLIRQDGFGESRLEQLQPAFRIFWDDYGRYIFEYPNIK